MNYYYLEGISGLFHPGFVYCLVLFCVFLDEGWFPAWLRMDWIDLAAMEAPRGREVLLVGVELVAIFECCMLSSIATCWGVV